MHLSDDEKGELSKQSIDTPGDLALTVERYEAAKARYDEVTDAIAERSAKSGRLAEFIKTLQAQTKPVAEFDERLWGCMVDYVTVGVDGGLTVVFRDGEKFCRNSKLHIDISKKEDIIRAWTR